MIRHRTQSGKTINLSLRRAWGTVEADSSTYPSLSGRNILLQISCRVFVVLAETEDEERTSQVFIYDDLSSIVNNYEPIVIFRPRRTNIHLKEVRIFIMIKTVLFYDHENSDCGLNS